VQVSIQGDVSARRRQEEGRAVSIIGKLREHDLGIAMQLVNFRD
jgi:uncharacterized protein YajQ (UPF0234 family)